MTKLSRLRSKGPALACALALGWPHVVLTAQTKPAPVEPEWPRTYGVIGGYAVMHTPQVASWDQQTRMVAWSAVSYYKTGVATPSQGVIRIEASTRVAVDERLVSFSDMEITQSNFATLAADEAAALVRNLKQAVPESERVIALDRVLAAVDKSTIRPADVPGVKSDPPKIFTSTKPAVLVVLDGDVVWSPIRNVELQFAVNTNWDLFHHTSTKTFYLRNERSWYKASAIAGPWTPAGTLPESFQKLPADENFKEVRAAVPGVAVAASAMPAVFVSTEPAELLLLNGAPSYQPVPGTSLLWVSNTESDLFRAGKAGLFYYLVAGRWFSAPDLNGPWTFATTALPDDFKRIPIDHVRSRVLASVPGTEEANEAVLLARIPQTARVNRNEVKAPDVVYQGDPQFDPIPTTTVSRGANTDKDIFKIGDRYYMCYQAIWFVSATASGPWEVATSVPDVIYDIPASSPSHNVTYVTIEDDDPADEWVTFAYVAGYTGMMIAWGCAVWGTGWYYPPYVRYGGFYPIYHPYPRTYGFSAWYNPYTGNFGRAAAVYGPFGGAGAVAVYNPRTGTYARGAAAYGPYGSRSVGQAFNPRTGAYAAARQGSSVYGNWNSSGVRRGDDWARTSPAATTRPSTTTRPAAPRTAGGGDVYAGHDGNVYRRNADGNFQQWNNGGWQSNAGQSNVGQNRPGAATTAPRAGSSATQGQTQGQLNRDANARTTGNQRTESLGTYRSEPSRSAAGSYRGGAGGRSTGGRRGR
jgi:hypothetical protein